MSSSSEEYIGPAALIASIILIATIPGENENLLPLMLYNLIICVRHAVAPCSCMRYCYVLLCGATLIASITALRANPSVVAAATLSALATIELGV